MGRRGAAVALSLVCFSQETHSCGCDRSCVWQLEWYRPDTSSIRRCSRLPIVPEHQQELASGQMIQQRTTQLPGGAAADPAAEAGGGGQVRGAAAGSGHAATSQGKPVRHCKQALFDPTQP